MSYIRIIHHLVSTAICNLQSATLDHPPRREVLVKDSHMRAIPVWYIPESHPDVLENAPHSSVPHLPTLFNPPSQLFSTSLYHYFHHL